MIEEKQGSEEKLIADLVGRANAQVKLQKGANGYQTAEQISLEQIRKKNEEALIQLSANKLNVIISGLAEGLDALTKNKSKDDTPEKVLKYQAAIVDLMAKCMAHSWDHIKGQFRSVQGLDEKEAIRLKEKEEQILPPPLEETLAKFILVQVMQLLLRPEPELHDTAGRLLFQLSATNYESVFSKIAEAIHAIVNGKDTDDTTSAFTLIECLNLNSRRLSELLERINKNAAHFKKDKQQNVLSTVLRKAIWNWIDNYPMEFVSLCQSGARLAGAPDALFDVLDGWSKKNKNNFWPLQTMLLVLSPDIMLKISLNKDKGADIIAKEKFLETIKKALKTPKTAEMAAVCYVDICKASTFVSKQDVSALRYLVPGIETDLKEKLFNTQVPFRKGGDNGAIDVDLMTDCLVSSFRIGPRKALGSLFPECVHADAPPHFKMVLVKGLLRIAKEDKSGANLPWNPSISDVYASLAGPLKTLFQDYVQGVKTYNTIKTATDKKTKQQAEKLAYDIQILALLIELFDVDANFILFPLKTPAQDLEDVRSVMVGLCYCASLFSMPELSDIAPRALLGLHLPGNIEKWSSKSAINGFWEISSSVNVTLANGLIDQKDIKPDQIQKLVTLLESILIRRNNFLDRFKENHRPEPQLKDVRFQGSTKLEVALLIHLCSAEPDICSKCATCFGLLCDEVDIFGEADEGNSIVANYSVYRKLSTTGIFQVGRQHQQKGIRMLLRRVDTPTTGNFAAWEDVYYRWKTATDSFLTPEDDKTKRTITGPTAAKTPAEIQQWQNYLGFLVGLSGVTLNRETTVKVTAEDPKKRNKGPISTEKTVKLTDSFIIELLELLVCDNAFVRETVMSLTGTSLSPASYAVLFRNLQDEVQGLFGDAGQVDFSERSVLFVDQAVSIVKHILESPQQSEDLSLVTSFESLILLFVKFVSQLLGSSSSLRIKKNMCSLLENMMAQRQNISFKHEYDFRNTLVETVVEWTTDFAIKGNSQSPSSPEQPLINTSSEKGLADSPAAKEALLVKRLQKELDVACIASVALLLRGLPLPQETQSVKFMKYFSFFTTLLTRCKTDADSPVQLAENAIKALSNLLSANIQAGLEYFVTMGYHDDHDTRSAFLKVISNILAQGTEFDQLEEGEKYEKLLELLLEPEMSVVLALGESTQITEADEVAHLLVRLFESNDRGLSMVKMVVTAEVNITETANTLFRRNSVATKVLSSYTRLIGPNYLKDTILPALKEIMETPTTSYEIAPDTMLPGEDVAKNLQNLIGLAKLFINAIARSSSKLPLQLHEICNFMYKIVGERYPGSERIAVGGFMFLRFLCPAIVAPEAYGLVGAGVLSKEIRRGLVLVTKVLQHLANGMTSFREPYMSGLEPFVAENQKTIEEICDKFAVIPPDSPPGKSVHISSEQQEEDLILVHHHISMNLEKITKILEANHRETAERLASVLQKLGPPPEQPKKTTAPTIRGHTGGGAKNSNLYDEFMRNNADKNTDSIKQKKIVFIQGVSKPEKLPVVYFITRRMDNTIDMELLLLHILRTLQEIHNKPFVLVIDCSFFGPEHQIALPWFVKFIRHFPDSAGENLRNVFILNPNHWFKKYSKRIARPVGRMQKKITFLTNVLKLSEHIVEPEAALPASTMAVENDVKATFTQVHKLSTHHGMKEVILRINSDLLQLSTIKLHPVLGKTTNLIDLHHIATFQEVSHSSQDHEFVVKYDENGGQKSMTLRSTSSQQIIQALKAAKTRWNLAKPASASARSFRPSDIPGTLLNVALLNLGSPRGSLRVAAYNMLTSLCKNSNFSIKMYLLDAPGLCIPKNSTAFVVRVSEKLARTEIHLTLEFLLECLHGITRQQQSAVSTKSQVLDYMQPWLPNLALFCQKSSDAPEKYTKVVEVLNNLIELTIRETNLKTNVLASVWRPIGKVDNPELVSLAVKCCLKQSIASGLGSMRSDIIGEIVYTMSAENPQLVGGKVVTKVLKGLEQTGQKPTSDLSESDVFPKLSVLLRLLLVLAFDDMISVQQYLPELFHIVLMLFATGSAPVRASSHGLLVNIVHSLYTSMVTPDNKLQSLHFHLADFGQLSFRLLFGIGGSNVAAFSAPDPTHAKELEKMAIMSVDVVAAAMLNVLNSCSPAYGNAVFTAWHSRWLALTTAAALQNNPALQARAFIVLGVLCKSSDLVTDDLMDQVLSTLKNVCANPKSLQDNNDLLVGIIACLTRLYRYLPPTSKYARSMFWIGMTIVQIYEPRVFTAGIALLETIITVLDSNDAFKDVGLAKTLLASRTPIQGPLARLDTVTGINFESNFSFAVACHLLKGLRHPSTKTSTARLLTTFLGITAKRGVGAEILGYLTALLPTEGIPPNMDQLIPISGDGAKSVFQYLFSESMIPDVDHGALVFTLLATILQNTDREHEQLFIYEALREGISYMPSAFPVTYKTLIPKMSTVISSGQNDKIVETALEIMESMFSFSMESALNKNRLNISHLKKLGFHGIPECGLGFNRGLNQLNEAIMKIITETIGTILPPKPTPR